MATGKSKRGKSTLMIDQEVWQGIHKKNETTNYCNRHSHGVCVGLAATVVMGLPKKVDRLGMCP